MDSCSDTFGNLIRYFAFRRYLIDLKSFRRLLGFEMVEKQSKNIIESQKCTEILGGGALYPEIDQSGSAANGMSSKQHRSISVHFCLIFLSDRELLDCSNCAIPTNCQGEAKFHLRSVKVSRSQNPAGKGYRACTLPGGIWARTMDQTLSFVSFLEPETVPLVQNRLRTSRFPTSDKTNLMVWVQG